MFGDNAKHPNISYSPLKQSDSQLDIHTAYSNMSNFGFSDAGHRSRSKRKCLWGIGIAVVVIALFVIVAALLVRGSDTSIKERPPAITLEDVLKGKLAAKPFNATWVSDTQLLYNDAQTNNIILYNLETHEKTTILSNDNPIIGSGVFDLELSADQKYLLLAHSFRKLYRHSYLADYEIVDLQTQKMTSLKTPTGNTTMQLATWAPQGNGIVFVFYNNIYYKKEVISEETVTLTSDGLLGVIYNGVPDWVYEEEVFSSNKALWFSPDGKKLAYASFNDNQTRIMNVPIYGPPGDIRYQYPPAQPIRYPKAGTPNPTVKLTVVDLEIPTLTIEMTIPSELSNLDPILTAVSWASSDTITAIWMNRLQNQSAIVAYKTSDNKPTTIASLSQESGWIELFRPPLFSSDGKRMILILSQDQGGDAGAFRHITMYDVKENAPPVPVTNGKFVVTDIASWDDKKGHVYYLANTESDPAILHLYRISDKPSSKLSSECLTCDLKSTSDNENCLYNGAEFSKGSSYAAVKCLGPGIPEINIYGLTGENITKVLSWENNKNVHSYIKDKLTPIYKRFYVEIGNGYKAQVKLQLPPDVDTSGKTKYPLLVKVYGGPDSYLVTERFELSWESYLAANKSILIANIDGRGSGLKGDKMLFAGYRNLGSVEIIDQINVTRHIQRELPYVDAKRTAIWGWSYGGYATGMALATDANNVFQCGISVAPVTDWALYDSIYTERFMGLPTDKDNKLGYSKALLSNKVEGIRNKEYLLIHGTMDDNVHYQQSMLLARALEQHDILFQQMSYPDEDHGLIGVRPHLYHTLEGFLDGCFDPEFKNV